MKQVIPFTKDIVFNTKISEITSISLEHNYTISDDIIMGTFIISGDYKIHDASIEKEDFDYKVPFDIDLTNRYDIKNCTFEIDDFYYEIIDNNTMRCHIEVSIDELKEKEENVEIIDDLIGEEKEEEKLDTFTQKIGEIELEEDIVENNEEEDDREVEVISVENEPEEEIVEEVVEELIEKPMKKTDEVIKEVIENKTNNLNSDSLKKLFDEDTEEVFSSYKIYIIRENDTIDTIIKKYGITKEILSEYNDIDNIKLSDKIIIPYINEQN